MSDIQEQIKLAHKRVEENDYKKECFKRLEYTNKYSKYSEEDLIEEIIEKDIEIEKLKIEYQILAHDDAWEIADYKSRNEKAIEFVNEFIQEDYYEKLDEYITHFTWNTTKEDLLNILQGVDKE